MKTTSELKKQVSMNELGNTYDETSKLWKKSDAQHLFLAQTVWYKYYSMLQFSSACVAIF